MNRLKIQKLRQMIEKLSSFLKDKEAQDVPELFPSWKINQQYNEGDRIQYNSLLYRVLQNHISQSTWTPDNSPSLFARILIIDDEILDWIQPDSTNPYHKGDKVKYNGEIWTSIIDNNVWVPGVYGWEKE